MSLAMQVDELFLLSVQYMPQLLLVVLVGFIFTLFAKDIWNGWVAAWVGGMMAAGQAPGAHPRRPPNPPPPPQV